MIPFEALTEYDFEILKKCSGGREIEVEALASTLPAQKAVKLRIKLLSKPDYVCVDGRHYYPSDDSRYLRPVGKKVAITELGQKALEDYSLRAKAKRWNWIAEFVKLFAAAFLASLLTKLMG